MTAPPEIALTQLALWYDPSRIQTWPAFLGSVPDDVVAGSPTDLGRRFATQRMTSERHSSAFNLVRNLPGLERRGGRLQLRGVGYLRSTPEGYRVSPAGRALAQRFEADPSGTAWVRSLADRLIGFEPRTRALVGLLSEEGAELRFDGDGWFAGSYAKAIVSAPGRPDLAPLTSKDERTLRDRLTTHSWWCLGDWRGDPLLEGAQDCRLVGLRSEAPSLHDVGLALRSACEVLLAAGLLTTRGGVAWLDTRAAAEALPDRAADFGWASSGGALDLVDALAAVLPELRSPTGHVVASELRAALQDRGHADPDRALAEAEAEGTVLVYAEDYGQSRHGRGLYGDPRKQLVKLRIVGRESHS